MSKPKNRTTNRGSWNEQTMKNAVDFVLEGKMGVREAAHRFGVPKSSLHDRVTQLRKGEQIKLQPKLGRFEPTFIDIEEQLLQHVQELDNRLMPLTKKEFLKLAYDLAENLKLDHRFNKETKTAGKHFYKNFMERHPELSLRTPESTSLMRCVGFNKPQVELFFNKLDSLIEKHHFPPSRIYNADETGVSCVHKNQKVLSTKGKRQVGKLTSGERGKNITLMFGMNPTGHFIPPLFIFPRQRMNERLMLGAPEESVAFAQPSGWMNGEIFLLWLKHFAKHVRPTANDPVLLVLDGHASHKELPVILFAREHNIHMISIPPHTTHKLQPLDRSFMKPFKDAMSQEMAIWMRRNAGQRIIESDMAGIVSSAFTKVSRLEIARSGFSCTGIHPFNANIFPDLDFLPCQVTDMNVDQFPTNSTSENGATNDVNAVSDNSSKGTPGNQNTPQPSISGADISQPSEHANGMEPEEASNDVSAVLQKISPLPDASKKRLTTRKRKAQRSEILTSTPYKSMMEEKSKRGKTIETKKRQNCKRNLDFECGKSRNVVTSNSSESKTQCIICQEEFDEDWIQCSTCKGWAHEECASIDPADVYYHCDVCTAKNVAKNN